MKRYKWRSEIQRLMLIAMGIIFAALVAVEAVYLAIYRTTIAENTNLLNEAQANKIYNDLNDMWYQMNLLSATISRCDAMEEYLYSENGLAQAMELRRFVVYLVQTAGNYIDSVIVTDLEGDALFAYGAYNAQVIEDVKTAVRGGLRVKNPTHLQRQGKNGLSLYCVNCTETLPGGTALYTIITYNIEELSAEFEEISHEERGMNLLLLDGGNEVILQSLAKDDEELETVIAAIRAGEIPNGVEFYQVRNFSLLQWRLITFVLDEAVTGQMEGLTAFAYLVGGAAFVLLSIFFRILNRQINAPIRQIVGFMRRQAENPSEETLEIGNKNELEQIASGLNDMLQKQYAMSQENLRNREHIFETELAQKESEILALTHQINPHFLYNTLDCMRGMAMAGGMDDLERMIVSLARVFRYATRASAFVTLREEIQNIVSYMEIVRIRYGDEIGVRYFLREDTLVCAIPKMILQPVVENAIAYGMRAGRRRGTIEIRSWTDGGDLYLTVRDDGVGMDAQALCRLRENLRSTDRQTAESGERIGLRNIQRRLRLLYGEAYGLSVASEEGRGTELTLRLRKSADDVLNDFARVGGENVYSNPD